MSAALLRFYSREPIRYGKVAAMLRFGNTLCFGLLAAAALGALCGCGKDSVATNPQHDLRTEAQREQDCADPQWKAANLGLWYNICSGEQR
jgi:hypothetical protein